MSKKTVGIDPGGDSCFFWHPNGKTTLVMWDQLAATGRHSQDVQQKNEGRRKGYRSEA